MTEVTGSPSGGDGDDVTAGLAAQPVHAPDLDELQRRLGTRFDDPSMLLLALTHRSYAFEHPPLEPNERLEFLGDAVLALVVTDEIYHAHPHEQEGRLAKVRAAAVKTVSLADLARGLGLGDFLRLGRGEAASGGAGKDSILADGLEAVLGACYLDRGYPETYEVVQRLFARRLDHLGGVGAGLDFKTSLQELAAAHHDTMPYYDVVDEGPDHAKTFDATVRIDGRVVGQGTGRSKKEAEQAAAKQAWTALAPRAGISPGHIGAVGRPER